MLKRVLINAVALGVATWILPGMSLDTSETVPAILTMLGVALVFGILNALVKPIFTVLTSCLVLITLGVFLFVIDMSMMMLTSWVCDHVGLGWAVDGWGTAALGALLTAVVGFLTTKFLGDEEE